MGLTILIYGFAFISICLMIWSDAISEDARAAGLLDRIGYMFAALFVVSGLIQIAIHYLRV